MKRRWTDEEKALFQSLAGTMTPTALGERLGRSKDSIINRGVVLHCPVGYQRKPRCRQRLDEMRELAEKLSIPQIARELGLDYERTYRRMKANGIVPKVRGWNCKAGSPSRIKTPPKKKIKVVHERLVRCECGLWVVNTLEGIAAHRERVPHEQNGVTP